jgi:DNA-binding transcriptional ArsR family regulator
MAMGRSYQKILPARWAGLARVFTALGDECRQRMLLLFGPDEEITIKDIARACPLSRTAVAHHVRVLRDAGVLRARKSGREVYLSIDTSRVLDALDALRDYVREKL